jgi:hypothetical protein
LSETQIDPLGRVQKLSKPLVAVAHGDTWKGVKATLKVAHLGINDAADAAAFGQLEAEYVSLFRSKDFLEGRKAEAENRQPIFHGR